MRNRSWIGNPRERGTGRYAKRNSWQGIENTNTLETSQDHISDTIALDLLEHRPFLSNYTLVNEHIATPYSAIFQNK